MYRAVAQLVARLVWDQEVVSSNLTGPIGFPPKADPPGADNSQQPDHRKTTLNNYYQRVYQAVSRIPKGKVGTYGQIAAMISTPRAARMVGTALRQLPSKSKIPWWRVINSRGMISIENLAVPKPEQARYLQVDGIKVKLRNGNYWVDLKKYLWKGGQVR